MIFNIIESLERYKDLTSDPYLQCENILKDQTAKFEELHHKFMKDKADHLQGLKGIVSICPLVLPSLTFKSQ